MKNEALFKYLEIYHKNPITDRTRSTLQAIDGFFEFLHKKANQFKTCLSTPGKILWEITRKCNLCCKHCYLAKKSEDLREGSPDEELSLQDCEKLIKDLKKCNVLCVAIQGGEPFCRNDIFDILSLLKSYLIPVRILTNGTLIDKKIAFELKKILDPSFDYLQISLDGPNAKINDGIRSNGSFDGAVNAMICCRNESLPFRINYTLNNTNSGNIVDAYKVVNSIGGAFSFGFSTVMHVGRAKDFDYLVTEEILDQTLEIQALYDKSRKLPVKGCVGYITHLKGYKKAMELLFGKKPKILRPNYPAISYMDIDANGNCYPCAQLQLEELCAGNVKKDRLIDIWKSGNWKNLREEVHKIPDGCEKCDLMKFCNLGSIGNIYRAYGHFNGGVDPQCKYMH